ncbi:NAD(P)-dependent oxidoreductase [Pseudanabaena sp. FACHB-2040]|uniref:NAD-dependent epimerase/dehydratase family protein n=1 Tax=Pseudanabaena sp. FACHB-2040 TaxID=2692859 RepID=UPI0016880D88|nr:NAD(P)-dependent oxidoreductase [Pseudanabaena sp. FACHB-2040]MBD2260991.1 NAD(P)-dependent oxidoreductase [Pseudanabaena sp. FACHB-2040]
MSLSNQPSSSPPQQAAAKRIFITGASGCIGHYIVEALLEGTPHELFLLVRDPGRLKLPLQGNPRVHILQGDLGQIDQFAELLSTIDVAVLAAACWGGSEQLVFDINLNRNLDLINLLDPQRCEQVIYFSTASILDRQNQPLKEAGEIGTDYIRSKYECHRHLPKLVLYPKLTTVFPTLVFGGDKDKPYSFISAGLADVTKWLGLIRFLKADGGFHFAHAQDIAWVIRYLIEHPSQNGYREYVLGNPGLTVDQAVEEASAYVGKPILFRIPLSPKLADVIIRVFRIQMAPWDYFCVRYRHFVYANAVSPATFGLQPYCPTLADLFRVHGIMPR